MNNEDEFQTKDFYTACLLRALHLPISHLIQEKKDLFIFVFSDPHGKVPQIVSDYWDRKISVDARTFVEAINEIKTRIHASRRTNVC